jgi:hypothetical protein
VYVCKTLRQWDHLIWHCERFGSERHQLIDALSKLDVLHGTPVRDLCGFYESGVSSNVVWTSSEVLKSDSGPFIGP